MLHPTHVQTYMSQSCSLRESVALACEYFMSPLLTSGTNPQVVIRHSGLVARAVDTTHIAGVILKYVPPAVAQLAKASSHSSASRRCIPGLRIVSGRLVLKYCRVDCGRRREAANPGIWVGPECVLNVHRSSVEGDAPVGLQVRKARIFYGCT